MKHIDQYASSCFVVCNWLKKNERGEIWKLARHCLSLIRYDMTKIYSIGIIGGVDYRLHAISIELMGNGFVSVRVVKSLIRTPSENLN